MGVSDLLSIARKPLFVHELSQDCDSANCDARPDLAAPNRYHRTTIAAAKYLGRGQIVLRIWKLLRSAVSLLAAIAVGGALASCEVQTYDDAVASINNGNPSSPPPPPPPGSPPPPPPPPPPTGFNPVFSEIQTNVFTPDCASSSCHGGGAPAANLNLTAGNSYAMLVDIDSIQEGIKRVLPGDPTNSYLVQKLEGTAATGGQMPSTPLPQTEIDTIRQWITAGALDDTVVVLDPIRVNSISPIPGEMLTVQPTQIVAGFDRDLNAASVDTTTFLLEASGGDGTFNDNNEVQIAAASVTVPVGNQRSAVFSLAGVTLADDTYRISLLGSGGAVIQDLDANPLDGEYLGALPSGNSAAGGDFIVMFTLQTPVVIGPTLDQIQAVVFTPICSGCHTGPNGVGVPPASMDLTNADASLAALVNVPSIGNNGVLRVAPMDPNNSYLIQKLEGNAGLIMPPTGALDPAIIAEIRQWIQDGALR